ncbi:MAG: hypothetical protein OCD02_11240 [Spirochaetaceae bacterium]
MNYPVIIDSESYPSIQINHVKDVLKVIRSFIDTEKKNLFVLILDKDCFIQKLHILDVKKDNPELVPKICRLAILDNCKYIITANSRKYKSMNIHSGNIEVIESFVKAGVLINIKVLDHLFISKDKYFSYAESKLAGMAKYDDWSYREV